MCYPTHPVVCSVGGALAWGESRGFKATCWPDLQPGVLGEGSPEAALCSVPADACTGLQRGCLQQEKMTSIQSLSHHCRASDGPSCLLHRCFSLGTLRGARSSSAGSGKNSSMVFSFKELPLELVCLIASPGLGQVLCGAVPLALRKGHVLPWLHDQLGQPPSLLGKGWWQQPSKLATNSLLGDLTAVHSGRKTPHEWEENTFPLRPGEY